ncbi:unnamed protein product [Sphagnum jensenii]|uniref:SMP-LTD domain-containing protein n=1 Tax=Sphagnum jensenii TaxID=128206 RepID=A0ABP0V9D5_9BRYO
MPKVLTDLHAVALRSHDESKALLLKYAHSVKIMHGSNTVIAQTLRADILSVFRRVEAEEDAPARTGSAGSLLGFDSGLVPVLKSLGQDLAAMSGTSADGNVAEHAAVSSGVTAGTIVRGDEAVSVSGGSLESNTEPQSTPAVDTLTNPPLTAAGSADTAAAVKPVVSTSTAVDAAPVFQTQLNMVGETAAVLASCAPSLLPPLPSSFLHTVGYESCVWLNALVGRLYRDMIHSPFFMYWTVAKASTLLNKRTRPDYVDEFVVDDVVFGTLPPVFLNVQWVPATVSVASAMTSGTESPHTPTAAPPAESSSAPSDYDVRFTADVVFRSGLKIKVSTKLWLNWPRDRYASIPVSLTIDLDELSGRVLIGTDRTSLYVTFVEEPFTRLKITTEVGEQFKLRDVPQLSQYMTQRLKEVIRNRMVHPNLHRMKLPWPRNWWPSGSENEFLPLPLPILPRFYSLDPATQQMIVASNAAILQQFGPQIKLMQEQQQLNDAKNKSSSGGHKNDKNEAGVSLSLNPPGADSEPKKPAVSSLRNRASAASNVKSKISNWFKKMGNAVSEDLEGAADIVAAEADQVERKWRDVLHRLRAKHHAAGVSHASLFHDPSGEAIESSVARRRLSSDPPPKPLFLTTSAFTASFADFATSRRNMVITMSQSFQLPQPSPPNRASLRTSQSLPARGIDEISAVMPNGSPSKAVTKSHTAESLEKLRGRAWTLSDYRSDYFETLAVVLLNASFEQDHLSSAFDIPIDDNDFVNTEQSPRESIMRQTHSSDSFRQRSASTANTSSPTTVNTGGNLKMSEAASSWLLKAKDKYIKLTSTTMDNLLLGDTPVPQPSSPGTVDHSLKENSLSDPHRAKTVEKTPLKTTDATHGNSGQQIPGGSILPSSKQSITQQASKAKESIFDIGRRLLESKSIRGGLTQIIKSADDSSSSSLVSQPRNSYPRDNLVIDTGKNTPNVPIKKSLNSRAHATSSELKNIPHPFSTSSHPVADNTLFHISEPLRPSSDDHPSDSALLGSDEGNAFQKPAMRLQFSRSSHHDDSSLLPVTLHREADYLHTDHQPAHEAAYSNSSTSTNVELRQDSNLAPPQQEVGDDHSYPLLDLDFGDDHSSVEAIKVDLSKTVGSIQSTTNDKPLVADVHVPDTTADTPIEMKSSAEYNAPLHGNDVISFDDYDAELHSTLTRSGTLASSSQGRLPATMPSSSANVLHNSSNRSASVRNTSDTSGSSHEKPATVGLTTAAHTLDFMNRLKAKAADKSQSIIKALEKARNNFGTDL